MNREEKTTAVAELVETLGESQAIFAVDYRGISVVQSGELRSKLRESDAVFKVVKNRLAKRAAAEAGTEGLDELLSGPIALTLVKGDPVTAAKTIATFSRENELLVYRGGIMDGAPLDVDSFQAIARLPGVEVLYGQLVGLAASPLTGLVAGLSNLISGLGRQLAQIAEQGLVTGEAPEPAPPVEEPAPDEAPVEEPPAEDEPEPAAEAEQAPAAEPETSDQTENEAPNDEPAADPDAPGREAEEADGVDSPEEAQ